MGKRSPTFGEGMCHQMMHHVAALSSYLGREIGKAATEAAPFLDPMDVPLVQVALPTIHDDCAATANKPEWAVSGYPPTFAVLLVAGGRLGEIVGRQ